MPEQVLTLPPAPVARAAQVEPVPGDPAGRALVDSVAQADPVLAVPVLVARVVPVTVGLAAVPVGLVPAGMGLVVPVDAADTGLGGRVGLRVQAAPAATTGRVDRTTRMGRAGRTVRMGRVGVAASRGGRGRT